MAYNTTPFHGKQAQVEKNDTVVAYEAEWSFDVSLDMADASRKGQHWKEAIPGMAGATGSMTFYFVAGNTEQKALMDNIIAATPGTKLTDIKLLLDGSTNAIDCTNGIYITSMAVPTTIGDVVKVTFSFQLDGAPTLTDAA